MKLIGIFAACLVALPLTAQAQSPSVVDIAKQKASAPKPRRVYTNDDMPARPEAPASTPADRSQAVAPGEQRADAAAANGPASRNPDFLDADPSKANAADAASARSFVKAKQVQIDAVNGELQ